ncbi:hypothetical protein [Flavobacterium sp.]|uniref:hypothetical protein n=1 Tax=Flavobacterium sp. TaxID=239 RepID=UPI002B4B11EE|nr:hypothetical protein [Flavobacterium sp.]HLP62976.1 hypothetical protein [Flavobacterium sp.]
MKYLIYILFLNSSLIFSQNLESIKSKDTIYIIFNPQSNQERVDIGKLSKLSDHTTLLYTFFNDNHNISFYNDKYLNFDNIEINKESAIKILDNNFLRSNKETLLDIEFFLRNGFRETFYAIQKKHIFLVDLSEKNNNRYIFREVLIKSSFEEM